MIALLVREVILMLFLALLAVALLDQPDPTPLAVDFHHADFPVCVTVAPGPLRPHTHGTNLYPRKSDTA